MDWNTARSVLLVAAANRVIAGGDVGGFWPESNVFHFTRSVAFTGGAGTDAADPDAWFVRLRNARAQGVLLGSTTEFMEAHLADDIWRKPVEAHSDSVDGKGYSTCYDVCSVGERPTAPDILFVTAELETVLVALSAFAQDYGLEQFVSSFEQGLVALRSDNPLKDVWYAERFDVFDNLASRRLFAASQASNVFGSMGAWDDRNSADYPPDYQTLTLRLIAATRAAAQAAANATFAWP